MVIVAASCIGAEQDEFFVHRKTGKYCLMVKCLYPNLKEILNCRYETESTSLAKCPLRQVWREALGQWNPKCPGMAMSNWREVLALGSSQRLVHWKTSPSGHIHTTF